MHGRPLIARTDVVDICDNCMYDIIWALGYMNYGAREAPRMCMSCADETPPLIATNLRYEYDRAADSMLLLHKSSGQWPFNEYASECILRDHMYSIINIVTPHG